VVIGIVAQPRQRTKLAVPERRLRPCAAGASRRELLEQVKDSWEVLLASFADNDLNCVRHGRTPVP
jgi:hypothetical protein